jgi:hypothetical protein
MGVTVLPGAPAGCPTLPRCDEWGDGACHAHCWWDGEVMNAPDGATCERCSEDRERRRTA